jgi:hypothetical protein
MSSSLKQLLALAHRALSEAKPQLISSLLAEAGPLAGELADLLDARNGFFAYGPALHVLPTESTHLSWGLIDWNMPGLWKHEYASFIDPGLCFAEDVFGNQFSIRNGSVCRFSVETGDLESIASTIEEWASLVVDDDQLWTGWPIAQRWAERNGPIPLHKRLHPAVPFVCGGSYEIDNLKPVDAAEMMAKWGSFATQIHGLPDGQQIKIVIGDDEPGDPQ